ncbi:TonB-dependent receptor [Dysgonomonas massiliensis]|uniref:TonB-dependent receptor n=1 Tax=Dysgonomonas massiliensis TaxID=2040292 RepID=UPI000C76F3AB|nr:TonB-dependent receptor [Dysgonomonas massiliensis]
MKKVLFTLLAASSIICPRHLQSQEKADSLQQVKLEEIVVSATRVGQTAPVAFSNLNSKEIKGNNAARNIPFVLQTLPSVVSFTEGGTAIGNTAYRIRGTDGNRINVTLNGMPLNNPESQDVFWVNLPDISNSLKSIQVQRGVGTSTNGAASFGASISLETNTAQPKAYGEASTAIGSYGAFISSIAAGTGILKNGLSLDGRYSKTTGDGYIRNGKVDHQSAYASASLYKGNQILRAIYMYGEQHTGITWNGIDPETMKTDRKYNGAGEYYDEAGNTLYYDNETDNYYSHIAQLVYLNQINNHLTLNASFNYNNGFGYYENYKVADEDYAFSTFGLQPQVIKELDENLVEKEVTYDQSDLVLRKMMSNNLYAGNINIDYEKDKLKLSLGGMYSYYDGSHFGKLIWVKYNQNIPENYKWNTNTATKRDINTFIKANYTLADNLNLFGELQYRYIDYRMKGFDDDLVDITQNNYYSFFNPKIGATYQFLQRNSIYASLGISNREPLRADLKESVKAGGKQKVLPERLFDYELGYKYNAPNLSLGINLYYMNYKDQLVLTGKLNDVGYKLQENVPDSYRMGIELEASWTPLQWLRLDANTTLSSNKIKNYTAYYDNKVTVIHPNGDKETILDGQIEEFKKSTDISFSPRVVGSGIISIMPLKDLTLSLVNKYVGKMFYDNTSNKENQLKDYFVSDFVAGYTFDTKRIGKIDLQLFVYNIWDKEYVANAWVDTSYKDGKKRVYKGLFPQAPCNIMARVGIRF